MVAEARPEQLLWVTNETNVEWRASETLFVVVDMWDRHWCPSATREVTRIAPAVNRAMNAARDRGARIVWAPSELGEYYANSPARKNTLALPRVPLPREDPAGLIDKISVFRTDTNHGCDVPSSKFTRGFEFLFRMILAFFFFLEITL